MKAYIHHIEITPSEPVFMNGYERPYKSNGVDAPLFASTFVLEIEQQPYVFSTIDSINVTEDFALKYRQAISDRYDCHIDNVHLSATHTHSSVAFFALPTSKVEESETIRTKLFEDLMVLVHQTFENLQEVTITYGDSHIEGLYGNRNEKSAYANKDVQVLTLTNSKGEKQFAVFMSCHPTYYHADNTQLSPDIIGAVREEISQRWQGETIVFNGDCGDVSTRFYRDHLEEGLRGLAISLTDQLTQRQEKNVELHARFSRPVTFTTHFDVRSDKWSIERRKQLELLEESHQLNPLDTTNLYRLRLKDAFPVKDFNINGTLIDLGALMILCVPGELVSQLGVECRSYFAPKPVLIMAYCDNYVSYLVEKENVGKYFESYVAITPLETGERFVEKVVEVYEASLAK